MQLVAEQLSVIDQFQGVDQLTVKQDGSFEILERIEGGRHMVSICQGPPVLLGWATGNLPEPKNNPQVGMTNMRVIMPALQKTKPSTLPPNAIQYLSVTPPKQQRQTRIVKDQPAEAIAAELLEWISQE
jgi:electron transfer flavoprotein beta subunit